MIMKKFSKHNAELEEFDSKPQEFEHFQSVKSKNDNERKHAETEDDEVEIPEQARGRRLEEATSLRIRKIEHALNLRSDLSETERRLLRSRKNTASFRERKKQASQLKYFLDIELDLILEQVSTTFLLNG